MISCSTQKDYLTQLASFMTRHRHEALFLSRVMEYADELFTLLTLSLDGVRDRLTALYCPTNQGDPRDPSAMLRSWLLMTWERAHGPDAWVKQLRRDPLLAVLAGFTPDDVPGATTHRDFLARVADGPYAIRTGQTTTRSASLKGRHSRRLKDATEARRQEAGPNTTQSAALVDRLLKEAETPRDSHALDTRLQNLLVELGLLPTLKTGLCDNTAPQVLDSDGTILETAASPEGQKTCDCEPRDPNCDHPREYTSPTAQWCKDSHHREWRFGDRTLTITLHVNGHDFPLISVMGQGNESDFTLAPKALDDLLKLIKEFDLPLCPVYVTGDGHHDCQALYCYLDQKGLIPIIPLRDPSKTETDLKNHPIPARATAEAPPPETDSTPAAADTESIPTAESNTPAADPKTATKDSTTKRTLPRPQVDAYPTITFDSDGTPLCPGLRRMRHHGYNRTKAAHSYNCPAMRPNGKHEWIFYPEDCPFKKNCHPGTKMGLGMYIKSEADLRLFPPVPRDSTRFKTLYNERTSVERSNAVEDSYHLDHAHRNAVFGEIRLCFVNICKHARIRWIEATKRRKPREIAQGLLDWLLLGEVGAPLPV